MSVISPLYGANSQAITITLNSLANSTATFPQTTGVRGSAAIDNTTNLYLDALVSVIVNLGGTVANDKAVYVFAYGTVNGGTNYTGNVTGTDAAQTMRDPTVLRLLGVIPTPDVSVSVTGGPWSVALAFGGFVPDHWGIVVRNYSGGALAASGNSALYQGIQTQVV